MHIKPPALLLGALIGALGPSLSLARDSGPAAAAPRGAVAAPLQIGVDPRVELAAAMARLAGFPEYQGHGIAAYDRAVDAHFQAFRDHPSIAALRALRETHGIAYNAVVEAALAAMPDWSGAAIPLAPWPATLDARWDAASLQAFFDATRAFQRDSGATAFFAGQRALQAQAEASVRANLQQRLDLDWYLTQVPPQAVGRFTVIPGLLDGLNSYAARIGDTVYGVLATPAFRDGDPITYPADAQLSLLVHEFHHSFLNPWVDRHAGVLSGPAERLFAVVGKRMQELAYGSPRILLYETLVRANTIRYLRSHGEAAVLKRVLDEDRGKGFPWTPALADLLDATAAAHPRLDGDVPARVAALLDDWARDNGARIDAERQRLDAERTQALARGPQLETLSPAEGAVAAAGGAVLELRFDRPMDGRIAIFGDVPKVTGKPQWDGEKRTLRIPVLLEAGARYRLLLNNDGDGGFASADGGKLTPRVWTFAAMEP